MMSTEKEPIIYFWFSRLCFSTAFSVFPLILILNFPNFELPKKVFGENHQVADKVTKFIAEVDHITGQYVRFALLSIIVVITYYLHIINI